MSFVAVQIDHKPTRDFIAYGQLIISLWRKHGGRGWLLYDTLFRQQRAAGASYEWAELHQSMLASTVFGSGTESAGRSCALCFSSDHATSNCALAALEPRQLQGQPTRVVQRFRPYDEICRKFNRGVCSFLDCKFAHVCSSCRGDHSARDCKGKPPSKKTLAVAKPPTS